MLGESSGLRARSGVVAVVTNGEREDARKEEKFQSQTSE